MNKVIVILSFLAVYSAAFACPRKGQGGTELKDGPLYLGIYTPIRSPGLVIDSTMWDLPTAYEQNKKIVLDPQGGIQTTLRWASLTEPDTPYRRCEIWTSDRGWWYSDPRYAEAYTWGGCGTMDVLSDGRSVQAFHDCEVYGNFFIEVAVDSARGRGKFNHYWPDSLNANARMCPIVAVDDSDYIHVLADWLYYTRSTDQGNSWTPFDTVATNGDITNRAIIASKRSGKLCRAWARTAVANIYWQISSDHGRTWTVPTSIPGLNPGDTMTLYSDFDVAFDQEDSLHFVFTRLRGSRAALEHYSKATGLTRVATAWWPSDHTSGPPFIYGSIARPTLGVDEYDHLWCAWAQYDTQNVAANGVSNGQIYLANSTDHGVIWGRGLDLTNSPTPNCTAGICEDDGYPNIAGIVNDTLHLWYMCDREAGCQKWSWDPGPITMNPILYLRIPITSLGCVEIPGNRPVSWAAFDVLPNPFLSEARVRGHERERFVLYDLTGRRVRTDPGDRIGEGLPAGIYFLRAADGSSMPVRVVKVR